MRVQHRIFAAAILCAATGLGCNGPLSLNAKALLNTGNEAYRRGEYETTVAKMDAFVKEAGRNRRAAEGHYLRGLANLKLKNRK